MLAEMPEGDVVWRAARQLHEALAGQVLTRSDFRVPRYATTDLTGRRVTEAVARGKHLLTRVDGGVTVHTHLRMDGSWRIRPAGGYPPRDHRIRLVLANEQWQAIGYQLGVVEVLPTSTGGPGGRPSRARTCSGRTGTRPRRSAACGRRRTGRSGEALLDQRNLAGIGNLYKAETLFLRGISPWRPVGDDRRPAGAGRAGPAAAGREQGADRPGHHGQPGPRRGDLGLRPGRPAVPPLRHADPQGRPGTGGPGAGHVLVPGLPARLTHPRRTGLSNRTQQPDPAGITFMRDQHPRGHRRRPGRPRHRPGPR